MRFTIYEQANRRPARTLKTAGGYKMGPDEVRTKICKCNNRSGDWVTGCRSCGRRISA